MRSIKRDPNLYVAVDESNHGRFPEYFVAAFSDIRSDIIRGFFKKERVDHSKLLRKLIIRDYSFLLLNESDLGKNPKRNAGKFKLMDRIVASLVLGTNLNEYNKLKIMLDGNFTKNKLIYIKDAVSDTCSLEKSRVIVDAGPQFDEKYFLVNLADEMAHYLFRHVPKSELDLNPHKKELLK